MQYSLSWLFILPLVFCTIYHYSPRPEVIDIWGSLIEEHNKLQLELLANQSSLNVIQLAFNFYNKVSSVSKWFGLDVRKPSFDGCTWEFWLSVVLVNLYCREGMGGPSAYLKDVSVPSKIYSIKDIFQAKPHLITHLLSSEIKAYKHGRVFLYFLADFEADRLATLYNRVKSGEELSLGEYNGLFHPETIVVPNLRGLGWNFAAFMLIVLFKGGKHAKELFPMEKLRVYANTPFKTLCKIQPEISKSIFEITNDKPHNFHDCSSMPKIKAALKEFHDKIEVKMYNFNQLYDPMIEEVIETILYPEIFLNSQTEGIEENLLEKSTKIIESLGFSHISSYFLMRDMSSVSQRFINAFIIFPSVKAFRRLYELRMYLLGSNNDSDKESDHEYVKVALFQAESRYLLACYNENFPELEAKFGISKYTLHENGKKDLEDFYKNRIEYLNRAKLAIVESSILAHFQGKRTNSEEVRNLIEEHPELVKKMINENMGIEDEQVILGFAFFSEKNFKTVAELWKKSYISAKDILFIKSTLNGVIPDNLKDLMNGEIEDILNERLEDTKLGIKQFIAILPHLDYSNYDLARKVTQQLESHSEQIFQSLLTQPIVFSILYFLLVEREFLYEIFPEKLYTLAESPEELDDEFINRVISKARCNLKSAEVKGDPNYEKIRDTLSNPELTSRLQSEGRGLFWE